MAKEIDKIPIPANSPIITSQDISNAKTIYEGDFCDVLNVQKNGK